MNKQMLAVMQRRAELLAKIAVQRGQVAEIGAQWQIPLAAADQGLAVVRFLRSNPVLVAGVAALLVIRRRGVTGLMMGMWRVWKGYRYFTAVSAKLSARL
ncbi:MAG: YqjK-like family protein [Gallionellaceae bacterium]|nr:YqjK-like family protein [Gallionellaceae bacterium]